MPPQLQAFPASTTRAWRRCLFSVHLSGVLTTWKPGNFLVYFTGCRREPTAALEPEVEINGRSSATRRSQPSRRCGAGWADFQPLPDPPRQLGVSGSECWWSPETKKVDCRSPKRSTASTFEENQSPNLIIASHQPSPCLRRSQKPGSRLPRSATARSMRSIKSRETPSACTRPA